MGNRYCRLNIISLKGLGHEIELKYFDKKSINKNLYLYWMNLRWSVLIAIFHAAKVKIYGRNIIYWWCLHNCNLHNCNLILSITILKWAHLRSKWTSKQHSRAANKFYCLPQPLDSLLAILKNILELEQWINRNQGFRKWTNGKQEPQINSVGISPINVIHPICFHLNRVRNCSDVFSSKEHFENSKTRRGS